jgi:hypothetical protein
MNKILLLLLASTLSLAQNYEFTALGSFGGTYTHPISVTNDREVVGWSFDPEFNQIGFHWHKGRMSPIHIGRRLSNVGYFINNGIFASIDGQFFITNNRTTKKVLSVRFPQVFTPAGVKGATYGTITDYGRYPIREIAVKAQNGRITWIAKNSVIKSINDHEVAVGRSEHLITGRNTAVIFSESLEYIYPNAYTSEAVDINNNGEILLRIKESETSSHHGRVVNSRFNRVIANLGYNWTIPIAINNEGAVLAKSMYPNNREGWLLDSPEEVLDLSSYVESEFGYKVEKLTDINDKGDIVGVFYRDINNERFFTAAILLRKPS